MRLYNWLLITFLAAFTFVSSLPFQAQGDDGEVLIFPRMDAKQMPKDFQVEAMKFTGPSGDGRRGFVVQTKDLIKGTGTRLAFDFQRDASGFNFQVIHPFEQGHVIVSVHSGVSIHRGGAWGDIGWGNPGTSDKVVLSADAADILPLKADTAHKVISQLSASGEYQLSIDGKSILGHSIKEVEPLILRISMDQGFWLGSSWDRRHLPVRTSIPSLKRGTRV